MRNNLNVISDPIRHYANLTKEGPSDRLRIVKAKEFLERAVDLFGGVPRVVDLGCGIGEIAGSVAKKASVVGIDVNEGGLKYARETYGIETRAGDIQTCEVVSGDILSCFDVLEHVQDPMQAISRWLPNFKMCVISNPIDEPEKFNSEHLWILGISDFEAWFTQNGYRIVDRTEFDERLGNTTIHSAIAIGEKIL
jgi:2-polyprenyl-3-methyl-5-hydroxy-6-metoxy-1,4-benzoquinol methylase